jgi:hypothetical protein
MEMDQIQPIDELDPFIQPKKKIYLDIQEVDSFHSFEPMALVFRTQLRIDLQP